MSSFDEDEGGWVGANRILIILFWWQILNANLGLVLNQHGGEKEVQYVGGLHTVLYIR